MSVYPPTLVASPERAALVHARQVEALFSALPISIAGMTVVALILIVDLWSELPATVLLCWLGAIAVVLATRVHLLLNYRRSKPPPEQAWLWARYWMIGILAYGVIWGSSAYFLWVPNSMGHQALLVIVLLGMVIGGVLLVTVYFPAFLVYVIPIMTPIIWRLTTEGDPLHLYIAATCFFLLCYILHFGRRLNLLWIASIDNELKAKEHELAAQQSLAEAARQKRIADEAHERAEAAAQAKSRFFEAASHDLRQPLQAGPLLGGLISERVNQPEVVELVQKTREGVDALERLFKELMDISSIDAHEIVPKISSVALQEVFDEVRKTFEPEAFSKGLKLRVVPTRAVVRSDPAILERMLRNLVSNALKYTSHGGIVLGCRASGNSHRIEVWDTGIGIAPIDQGLIFEEFYQVNNPARSSEKGMGLGLALVQGLASLLDHAVSVKSSPGKGSKFSVIVPGVTMPVPLIRANVIPAPTIGDLTGKLVVVIDDEAAIVHALESTLRRWGCDVIAADTGVAAIAQAIHQKRQPDLLIVDYRLGPNTDGFQTIAALRTHFGHDIPAVLLSGTTAPELALEAEARGLKLLRKPVAPGQLRALVSYMLRRPGEVLAA